MKCPKCSYEIRDKMILKASASINGKKSRRILSVEDARVMQKRSVEARNRNSGKATLSPA